MTTINTYVGSVEDYLVRTPDGHYVKTTDTCPTCGKKRIYADSGEARYVFNCDCGVRLAATSIDYNPLRSFLLDGTITSREFVRYTDEFVLRAKRNHWVRLMSEVPREEARYTSHDGPGTNMYTRCSYEIAVLDGKLYAAGCAV